MSETTTYVALVSDIQSYTEDDSTRLVALIPNIIARGCDRIQMDLDLNIWDTTGDFSLNYNSRSQTLPGGVLRIRSIYLQDYGTHLEERSQAYIEQWGIRSTGVPKFWNQQETTYLVGPAPDQNYRIGLTYIARLASLSASNATNWITQNAARLLLYACLAEAEKVLVAPAQASMWDGEYNKELNRQGLTLRGLARTDYKPLGSAAGVFRPALAATDASAGGGA